MVKLAENIGFGFDKIDDNWKAYNSTVPEYQIEFDSVVIDFKMEAEESVGETSVKTSVKITSIMQEEPAVTIEQLVEKTGLSRRGIEWNIDNLKKQGIIRREGSKKTGKWIVKTVE